MSDLFRLVYASKNLLTGEEAHTTAEIVQILEASQRNNAAVGVTGALLFNKGAFAQVLEGPRLHVENTFERIQRDTRHGDVTVLQCGPAEHRGFGEWSMAFVGHSQRGQTLWSELTSQGGFDLSRLDGDAVFSMLHGLVLEEEGVPNLPAVPHAEARPHEVQPADRVGGRLDVEQVRAEIAGLRPDSALLPAPIAGAEIGPMTVPAAQPPTPRDRAVSTGGSDSALALLRTALAGERQRIAELQTELDDAVVALAVSQDQLRILQRERDMWAGRAGLLASAMSAEAAAVGREATRAEEAGIRSRAAVKSAA